MAKPKFLSSDGVRTLVQYMKECLSIKVDKVAGKELSDNNYTNEDKTKLAEIESGSQVNIIESISVNNNAQAINDKNVNIAIPLVDATLKNAGQSADAKATGDVIAEVNQSISQTATAIRQEFDDADNQLAQEMTQALEELSDTIPTKTSDLTNDSNYATTGELTNGLATKEDALQYDTATATDVGKAMMPKTVSDGKVTSWEFGEVWKVDDVQIDGISILENKIANIPVATVAHIKQATDNYKMITPVMESAATFYGLAKVAGDITQVSSSNVVGTYTDEAKSAIKTMLGFATSADISDAIENLVNTRYYVCEPSEYNSTTYIPTLTGELGVIYLVPKPIGDTGIDDNSITGTAKVGTATIAKTNNIFYEYIYTGDKFEQIGDTKIDLTGYLTDTDIATDASVTTMLNQVFS